MLTANSPLAAFEAQVQSEQLRPLWQLRPPGAYLQPRTDQRGYLWRWKTLRGRMLEVKDLLPLGTEGSDRRVLLLQNPELGGAPATTRTLVAGVQLVDAGERAPVHRHTPGAIRFIIEGRGAFTFIDGEPCTMEPGDLVLTPNWTWHGHVNDSAEPLLWMDGLDAPLVNALDAWFQEERSPDEEDLPMKVIDNSLITYGSGALLPTEVPSGRTYSPLMRYPGPDAVRRLRALAAHDGSPYDGVALRYVNPVTGGPVLPTMACWIQLLRPGERTKAHRHTSSVVYHVVEGQGCSIINGERLNWSKHDMFVLPNWSWHEHVNASEHQPAILFSFSDAPLLEATGLFREEQYVTDGGHQTVVSDVDSPYANSTNR